MLFYKLMTIIKYNEINIKDILLGDPEIKESGVFIPIYGNKTYNKKIDYIYFQTCLLNPANEDKHNKMMLSLNNIENKILSTIILQKEKIFLKKLPNDEKLIKNFKSIISQNNFIEWPFQIPKNSILLVKLSGINISGSTIKLIIEKETVSTFSQSEPIDELGDSEDDSDSESNNSSELIENFELD